MAWELSRAAYDNKSFHTDSEEGGYCDRPSGMFIPPAGLYSGWKWWTCDPSPPNSKIYEYWFSNWKIDQSVFNNWLVVYPRARSPSDIKLSYMGGKMYVLDAWNYELYQYALSDPWVLGTATYDNVSFDPSAQESSPFAFCFSHGYFADKMYIVGADNETIYQYSLSTPWDIDTAIYSGIRKSLGMGTESTTALRFSPDGLKMFVMRYQYAGGTAVRIYQYSLSIAWRVSTATLDGVTLDITARSTYSRGMEFKADGSKLYIVSPIDETVYQYSLVFIAEGTTQAVTNIEVTTATGNGNITDDGGGPVTVRGFCYMEGTEGNPTTADSTAYDTGSFGTGTYTKSLTELSPGTNYRVRAYFINPAGTGYGDTVQILTKPAAPTNIAATDGVHIDKVVITWTKSVGATDYQVYRDDVALGWLGDVDTYDDTNADAPSITLGSAIASDGAHADKVTLSLSGASANNGTIHTYKVRAKNATGESSDSTTNTGYRGVGSLTYQWYRSAGDSNAGYSVISGAIASTYNDMAAPAPTITPGTTSASDGSSFDYVSLSISGQSANDGDGRYYKCYLTAEGTTPGYTEVDRGYRGAGSLTYQWQRSAGDSDADYSNISGATSDTHNDTAAPIPIITPGIAIASDGAYATHIALSLSGQSADGEGRYYVCVLNADGSDEETSSSDRGYRSVGDLTYQWQRSAADSDASYSNISSATAATYNDTGAPSDGSGRYYKCVEDATGANQQVSAADRGHRITLATVTTQAVSDIGEINAIGNGTITDIGYEHCSKRGVCWNLTGSPTVADDTSEELDDFGTGAFTRLMTGLTEGTTYYVKAYAYNSAGYSYGGEVDFTTETTQAATVTTLAPTLVEDGIANLRLALINKDDLIINPVGWYCDENAAPSTEYTETNWKAGGGGTDLALGIYSKYVKTLPTGHSTLYVQAWCDDVGSNRYTGSILSFDIPTEAEYTELPDIIFPELPDIPELPEIILPEIPAIGIDLPDINYNIGLDLYLDRTYTRKDLEELRRKCINYEKNYTDFCLILNHNTLLVKNFLQSAYNNGVLGGENEMFAKIYPSQQLTPLYLEPLEPNDFKGIINRFINNNTSNSMGLNHNFDLFKEWLNDYNYTSDGYKASYITPKEEIITNNEPTVKYLTGKINRLQREVSMASREITHNFNLMKEIIQ